MKLRIEMERSEDAKLKPESVAAYIERHIQRTSDFKVLPAGKHKQTAEIPAQPGIQLMVLLNAKSRHDISR